MFLQRNAAEASHSTSKTVLLLSREAARINKVPPNNFKSWLLWHFCVTATQRPLVPTSKNTQSRRRWSEVLHTDVYLYHSYVYSCYVRGQNATLPAATRSAENRQQVMRIPSCSSLIRARMRAARDLSLNSGTNPGSYRRSIKDDSCSIWGSRWKSAASCQNEYFSKVSFFLFFFFCRYSDVRTFLNSAAPPPQAKVEK